MRKILIILLLIGGSMHCSIVAQEIVNIDKMKVIDYINCKYTSIYVLKNPDIFSEKERNTIEANGINTVSIENAIKYSKLDSILTHGGLEKTAEKLTNRINDRNNGINDKDIFSFVDRVIDTTGFENFISSKDEECKLRTDILRWYFSKNKKETSIEKESEESNNRTQIQEKEKKGYNFYRWLSCILLGIITLYIFHKIIDYIKNTGDENDENSESYYSSFTQANVDILRRENEKLQKENSNLRQRICQLEKFRENKKDIEATKLTEINNASKSSDYIEAIDSDLYSSHEKLNTSSAISSIVSVMHYADVDVSDNLFVRTSEKVTRKSVYAIDTNKRTFTLINDEQLYEAKLSKVNTSGILDACEINGNYKNGKTVTITSGKVQQEENGKWRIINKAKIEIK